MDIASLRTAPRRLVLVAAGPVPVSLIALSAFGVFGLRDLATHLLVPALVSVALAARRDRNIRSVVIGGIVAGVVATAVYDAVRFGFLFSGLMSRDPIPHIGVALHLEPAWFFGYLLRYLGNGGGLAVAFLALGLRGVRAGILYGLAVCAGLLLTLVVTPYGQQMLFPLTIPTVVMATIGHAVYGAVLGAFAERGYGRHGVPAPVIPLPVGPTLALDADVA